MAEYEVATLVARLQADVAVFQANMRAADTAVDETRRSIESLSAIAKAAEQTLKDMKLPPETAAQTIKLSGEIRDAINEIEAAATLAKSCLEETKLPTSAALETEVNARAEVNALQDIEHQAIRTAAAVQQVRLRSSLGTFLPNEPGELRSINGVPTFTPGRPATAYAAPAAGFDRLMSSYGSSIRALPPGPQSYVRGVPGTPGTRVLPADWAVMAGRGAQNLPSDWALLGEGEGGGGGAGAAEALVAGGLLKRLAAAGGGRGGGGRSIANMAGFGGGGFDIPGWMFGMPWLRRGIRVPGARFGSLAALAGFGGERVLTSTLGVLGSMGGGLLGGGLLASGILGTSAVGMGTDMAGIGQAAGDIRTVSKDMQNLNQQIAIYGKNSAEAARAQAQLNFDLKDFNPIARNAVVAAAQTKEAFGQLFDKVTGQAEKTGAQIINQAMKTGEAFLPTIGQFAAQNMTIIQTQLQPFFAWLKNAGPQGGLGIFTDLEKIFQRNLPYSVHAATQAFELFMKVVDISAQNVGQITKRVDEFFSKWNDPKNFSALKGHIEGLIQLFKDWANLFGSLGALIYDLFKPAVGFGDALAKSLTSGINHLREFINLNSTQNVMRGLFDAHMKEVINGIGSALSAMMPFLEQALVDFMKMATFVTTVLTGALKAFADVLNEINKIPFADKIIGFGLALVATRAAFIGMVGIVSNLVGSFLSFIKLAPAAEAAIGTAGIAGEMTVLEGATVGASGGIAGLASSLGTLLMPAIAAFMANPEVAAFLAMFGAVEAAKALAGSQSFSAAGTVATEANGRYVGQGFTGKIPGGGYVKNAPGIVGPFADGTFHSVSKKDGYLGGVVTPSPGQRVQDPSTGTVYTYSGPGSQPSSSFNFAGTGGLTSEHGGGQGAGTGGTMGIPMGKIPFALPSYLTVLLAKSSTQGPAQQKAAAGAALSWVKAHLNRYSGQDLAAAYNEIQVLQGIYNNPSSAIPNGPVPGPGSATNSGLKLLSPSLATAVTNAQTAAASAAGNVVTGQFNPANLHAQEALKQVLQNAINYLHTKTQTLQVEKEEVTLTKEMAAAQRQITKELQLQGAARVNTEAMHILGLSPNGAATVPGVATLRRREQQILIDAAKRLNPSHTVHGQRVGGLSQETIAHLQDMSLTGLIRAVQKMGVELPKTTLDSLRKINEVFALAIKEHAKLSQDVLTNLRDRLSQIRNTIMGGSGGIISNYIPITAASLVRGLHLSPAERAIAEQRIAQALAHHGMKPGGPAIAGIPITSTTKDVSTVGSTIGTLNTGGTVYINNATIEIKGSNEDPKVLAAKIRAELLKNARRNPAQTRGPNAGRSVGLG